MGAGPAVFEEGGSDGVVVRVTGGHGQGDRGGCWAVAWSKVVAGMRCNREQVVLGKTVSKADRYCSSRSIVLPPR